jgi:non-homologous end joining protein Ku
MAPAIAHRVFTPGLVSIPVEIHATFEDQSIHFHSLDAKCGSGVTQQCCIRRGASRFL